MRLLALSEHFFPRIGGTTNYVHETCSALVALGVEVELLVPGPQPEDSVLKSLYPLTYQVTWIDAGYPPKGDPSRASRYRFCQAARAFVEERALDVGHRPDAVHVLFGLFLMEALDTRVLSLRGIVSIATIHNIPPQECGRSWSGQPYVKILGDHFRKKIVGFKNQQRLRQTVFDQYVVPSEIVALSLHDVLPEVRVVVIGHGTTSALLAHMRPPAQRWATPGEPLRLLTVGGWVPHKRQLIIPEIAAALSRAGVDFEWTIAGPSQRLGGYLDAVRTQIVKLGLDQRINIREALSVEDLAREYDRANMYVQPSTEEGFCITALDAAASGLPVIASPAGALPRIVDLSGGSLAASDATALSTAILSFVRADRWTPDVDAQCQAVRKEFTWDNAARRLLAIYEAILGDKGRVVS